MWITIGTKGAPVKKLQRLLKSVGFKIVVDGIFGPKTLESVLDFQAKCDGPDDLPLEIDGIVGPATWWALNNSQVPGWNTAKPKGMMKKALEIALEENGVREVPKNSNWGPVKKYLKSAGYDSPQPWCAAFTWWCIAEAAATLGKSSPIKIPTAYKGYTPSWLNAAKKSKTWLPVNSLLADWKLIKPGACFLLYYKKLKRVGHIGFIVRLSDRPGYVVTIEGNTNPSGSREGGGVYIRERKISSLYGILTY